MTEFFVRALWMVAAIAAGASIVLAGNLLTLWLLAAPQPPNYSQEPRAWTWDPFHNYTRRA